MAIITKREEINFDAWLSNLKNSLESKKKNFVKLENLKTHYDFDGVNNRKVGGSIIDEMVRIAGEIKTCKEQIKCKHGDIAYNENYGHDSHKYYFKTYCKDCNLIFDTDWV